MKAMDKTSTTLFLVLYNNFSLQQKHHSYTRTLQKNTQPQNKSHAYSTKSKGKKHMISYSPCHCFVPSWIHRSIICSRCLKNMVANSYSTIGVHSCQTIIFSKFCLKCTSKYLKILYNLTFCIHSGR